MHDLTDAEEWFRYTGKNEAARDRYYELRDRVDRRYNVVDACDETWYMRDILTVEESPAT